MRLFKCQACEQLLYFENEWCVKCGRRLGYLPEIGTLSALEVERVGEPWRALALPERRHRFCLNATYGVCNWLVPADRDEPFCRACRHNRTVPNVAEGDHLLRWRKIEAAKHRLFYTLIRLGLPLRNRADDPEAGLAFDFLADAPVPDAPKVMTGHDNGVITLSLQEADDAERERMRVNMREPYRTLLGHFRHEVGHYYWDRLVRDEDRLDAFRDRFGDERADYGEALQRHYARGVFTDWQERFVSSYASAHPWEDFAETWAHYLHIVDALEVAHAFGISVSPGIAASETLSVEVNFDPHDAVDVRWLIDAWLPISYAVNSLNRSLGHADLYPFVLTTAVIEKLRFVHELVHARRG